MLTSTETLYSLNHWKTSFRTYYRRDTFYKGFLLPDATWDPHQVNYGQTADTQNQQVVRSAQDKCEDLKDFLHTLVGYLPFPYLTEKIVKGSTNLNEVWEVIYDHYGLSVTGETLLDFTSMAQLQGESYRQFYDRLLSHARLHLPRPNITIDGVTTGANGEGMTIALMNFVAMFWLQKINPVLIDIVKTDFGRELRDGTQLCSLVPRLANSIESMLAKNNVVGNVDAISAVNSQDTSHVNRVRSKVQRKDKQSPVGKNPYCPECKYLARKLQLEINYNHYPSDCPRPKSSINLLLADVSIEDEADDPVTSEDFDFSGKNYSQSLSSNTLFQKSNKMNGHDGPMVRCLKSENVLDMSNSQMVAKILKFKSISDLKINKEKSPQLNLAINDISLLGTVDEGSELNCLCSSIAARLKLKFKKVDIDAMAAGLHPITILGVVTQALVFTVVAGSSKANIVLRDTIVVKNLGQPLLIGEPGKKDNNIITNPVKKLIYLTDIHNRRVSFPYHVGDANVNKINYAAIVSKKDVQLLPNDSITVPLPDNMDKSTVNVTLNRELGNCQSKNLRTSGTIKFINTSKYVINVPKNHKFLDVKACYELNMANRQDEQINEIRKIYNLNRDDWSHLTPVADPNPSNVDYSAEVSIDPDECMPLTWRRKFRHMDRV